MKQLQGRTIKAGYGEGVTLVTSEPIGFLGGVDPDTGIVIEKGHPLVGQSITGRVLVFPTGKGSTVGSYSIYWLAKDQLNSKSVIIQPVFLCSMILKKC